MKLDEILNEVLKVYDFDSWDNTESNFKDSIIKSLSPQLVYKLNKGRKIKIFEFELNSSIYKKYKDKVYINGEHVQLKRGYTVNKYDPGEYYVYIEDFDKIADSIFYECTELISIIIPNSAISIGYHAFWCCRGLASVTIGNSVTLIGQAAFLGCTRLISVEIPNSVKSIGESAFGGCTSLISVEIPNSVKSIGDDAFMNCTGLTSVTIPNSVTSIGSFAFCGCENLKKVYVEDIEKFKKIEFGDKYSNPTYYGAELIELKK